MFERLHTESRKISDAIRNTGLGESYVDGHDLVYWKGVLDGIRQVMELSIRNDSNDCFADAMYALDNTVTEQIRKHAEVELANEIQ